MPCLHCNSSWYPSLLFAGHTDFDEVRIWAGEWEKNSTDFLRFLSQVHNFCNSILSKPADVAIWKSNLHVQVLLPSKNVNVCVA